MGNQKPLASLSSGLLARKGHARPAMRPQGFGGFGAPPGAQDDLGWNDMGHDEALMPSNADASAVAAIAAVAEVPPVLLQREALHEEFAPVPAPLSAPVAPEPEAYEPEPATVAGPVSAPAAVKSVSVATAARIDRETHGKRPKAAFTLRLDQDRHLRLRLASALCNRSAQALVTDALDAYLQSLPEVEDLVRQLPPGKKTR
ncbi:MAG: hypothetical protein M3R41_04790 [Pseudomonadota bacterium]|nr:hypothetical protein [Pseudomonadota bacterium]